MDLFTLHRVRAVFRRRPTDQNMSAELQMHIDALTERNVASGMSAQDARYAALREFGGVDQIKERCRDEKWRGFVWLNQIAQDLRYAARQFRKSPGFTTIAILSLAIGISANTAIFSLLNAVIFRTLPVRDPEQLVLLSWQARAWPEGFGQTGGDSRFSFSYPAFERFRKADPALVDVFAFVPIGLAAENATVVINEEPTLAHGIMVTGNYFSGLAVNPILGRSISERDEDPGQPRVAVLSYGFWVEKFNRDQNVVGRTITINQTSFTVVGVAPDGFYGIVPAGLTQRPDVWIPFSDQANLRPWGRQPSGSSSIYTAPKWICLNIGARIPPSINRQTAEAEFDATFKRFVAEISTKTDAKNLPRLTFVDAGRGLIGLRTQTLRPLSILMYAVGLVLLIACANVATLLLARANAREREMCVRAALGASRARLIRQLLTESILLSTTGGVVGLLLAAWAIRLLVTMVAPNTASMAFDIELDRVTFYFTAVVSLVTGILFGIVPAIRTTQGELTGAMKQRSATSEGPSSQRVGKALVVIQLSVSLVLMISAGLFARTLRNMEHRDLGFEPRHLLLFGLDPTRDGYQGERLRDLYERIRTRIASLPGIEAVTLYEQLPYTGSNNSDFRIDGSSRKVDNVMVRWSLVGPDFCSTMKIHLLRGRDILASDDEGENRVGLVNETFVRRFLGDEDPLGRHFIGPEGNAPIEIVGVFRDAELTDLHASPSATVLIPYTQTSVAHINTLYYEVRTAAEPMAAATQVRKTVNLEAPRVPLIALGTQMQRTEEAMYVERLFARLATFFGAAALVLSSIGLYGTIAFHVSRRIPEFGVRIALGASPRSLLAAVLLQSLGLIGAGVFVGFLGSIGATTLLRNMFYGVRPGDLMTFCGAALVMTTVALLACWIPARRAMKLDPIAALRAE